MSTRLHEIERRLNQLARQVSSLEQQVKQLAQMLPRAFFSGAGENTGGFDGLCWCKIPTGGVAAATGTWPSMSPATFSADVYRGSVKVAEAATVYWRYKATADAGKLVPCLKNSDGSFDAILDSCDGV